MKDIRFVYFKILDHLLSGFSSFWVSAIFACASWPRICLSSKFFRVKKVMNFWEQHLEIQKLDFSSTFWSRLFSSVRMAGKFIAFSYFYYFKSYPVEFTVCLKVFLAIWHFWDGELHGDKDYRLVTRRTLIIVKLEDILNFLETENWHFKISIS